MMFNVSMTAALSKTLKNQNQSIAAPVLLHYTNPLKLLIRVFSYRCSGSM